MIEKTLYGLKKILNREFICNYLQTLEDPVICEVGIREGNNFDKMLIPKVKAAIGVDVWRETGDTGQNDHEDDQDTLDDQYRNAFNKYLPQNRIRIVREFSVKAAKFFPDETFHFVYIDADHTYEAVTEDLNAWFPKVKVGGVIGGHDYISRAELRQYANAGYETEHSAPFGVIEAVRDFRKKHSLSENNLHITTEIYSSYFMVKEK